VKARNRQIVEARAAGRPVQAIALEHGLSVARVSRIVQDHRKDVRIAELEAEVARLREACEYHADDARYLMGALPTERDIKILRGAGRPRNMGWLT
jgi:hypothetical protein